MAELVDAIDSKSIASNGVPVQVRMGAPILIKVAGAIFFMIILLK